MINTTNRSTLTRRSRMQAFSRLTNLSLCCFLLISGCALKPSKSPDEPTAVTPISSKKTRANKPYKVKGKTYQPLETVSGYKATGIASWYGAESGNRTANGERFNRMAMTAAHKTLPIPSKVRVTNLRNGRYVDVMINDRGPFAKNRLIDLSQGAAQQIGMSGLTEVSVESVDG